MHGNSVSQRQPDKFQVGSIGEQSPVFNLRTARIRNQLKVLVESLHLLRLRRNGSVRIDNPIAAEIIISRPVVKISAVRHVIHAVLVSLHQGLIHVVPDETALIHGIPVLQRGVFLHAAQGIAHGVHIFTQDKRLLRFPLKVCLHLRRLCVHAALHITGLIEFTVPEDALIVNQPGWIPLLKILRHGENIFARVRLISTGPDQDGRMVLIPLQHGLCAVHHALLPLRKASRHVPGRLTGPHLLPGAMTLQIRLVDQIDPVFITELIPS